MKLSRIIFFFFLLLLLFFSSALSSQPLEPTFSSFTLFPSRSLSRLEKRRSSSRRLCISRTNRQPRNVFRRLSTSPLSYRFLFSLFPSSSHCLRFACPFKSERTRAKLCETTSREKRSRWLLPPIFGKVEIPDYSVDNIPRISLVSSTFFPAFEQRSLGYPCDFSRHFSSLAMRQIRARNFSRGNIHRVPSFRISTIQQLSLCAINLPFEIIDARGNVIFTIYFYRRRD